MNKYTITTTHGVDEIKCEGFDLYRTHDDLIVADMLEFYTRFYPYSKHTVVLYNIDFVVKVELINDR